MTGQRLTDTEIDKLVTDQLPGMEHKFGSQPVRCQCTGHGKAGCPNPAKVMLAIHALHECGGDDSDENGNRTELQCEGCAQGEWLWAHQKVAQLHAAARRAGVQPMCTSCQKLITSARDLVPAARLCPEGVR